MLEKNADAAYAIEDVIAKRWSPRAFADKAVASEDVRRILEAARWAPSCYNEQPWAFIVAAREDAAAHAAMVECLVEGNRTWAAAAPVLMIACVHTTFKRNGKPNRVADHDLGLAVGNLTVQATAMGLIVHQMAGILMDRIRQVYALPEGVEAVTGIAVGYQGEPDSLPDALAERERSPRERIPQSDFVFRGSWGSSL